MGDIVGEKAPLTQIFGQHNAQLICQGVTFHFSKSVVQDKAANISDKEKQSLWWVLTSGSGQTEYKRRPPLAIYYWHYHMANAFGLALCVCFLLELHFFLAAKYLGIVNCHAKMLTARKTTYFSQTEMHWP